MLDSSKINKPELKVRARTRVRRWRCCALSQGTGLCVLWRPEVMLATRTRMTGKHGGHTAQAMARCTWRGYRVRKKA